MTDQFHYKNHYLVSGKIFWPANSLQTARTADSHGNQQTSIFTILWIYYLFSMNHSRHPQKSVIHAVASVRWHSRLLAKPKSFTLTDQMTRVLLGAAKRSTTIVRPALRIKAFLSRKAQITAALNWRLNPASPQIAGTGWMHRQPPLAFCGNAEHFQRCSESSF